MLSTFGLQAACNDEAENYERAFLLQLLGFDGSSNGKEVLNPLLAPLSVQLYYNVDSIL